ncbi:MAG: class I SAM-dependent methyltransferase [Anaerolineae bacterium]
MSVPCPQCKHSSILLIETTDINRHRSQDTFQYYRCSNCALVFLDPIPDNLGQYYQQEYYAIPNSLDDLKVLAESQRSRLGIVEQYHQSGRLLEIGSSYGDFAYAAKEAGYQVDVIEMDQECCNFLNTHTTIHAIQSDNPSETLSSLGIYDVIVMWQVIEHVQNPWQLLKVISEHLASGAVLILATPNPHSLQFRLFRHFWAHVDCPRHLQLIPPLLMGHYAESVGLKPAQITTNDIESLKHNTFGWKKSLMNRLGVSVSDGSVEPVETTIINFKPSRSLSYVMSRYMLSILIWLISLVFSPIERTGLRGSSYTAVLQKLP